MDASHLHVKPLYPGVLAGGLVFGVGWAVAGFCPGTGLVGAGAGRWDALFFVLGGLAGAGLFMLTYAPLAEATPLFQTFLGGKTTLVRAGRFPTLLGGPYSSVIAIGVVTLLIVLANGFPASFRRKEQ